MIVSQEVYNFFGFKFMVVFFFQHNRPVNEQQQNPVVSIFVLKCSFPCRWEGSKSRTVKQTSNMFFSYIKHQGH